MCDKENLFKQICNASKLGRLGFFIGAGFSKSVLKDNNKYKAYSWNELLEKCCTELEIEVNTLNTFVSNPEYASAICRKYAKDNEVSYNDAVRIFKEKICQITNTYAESSRRNEFKGWFNKILPSWIVTTNYDTLIENILGARALSISRNNCFFSIKDMIPVIHLHGICSRPDDIIITNEDYVKVNRPGDYWQQRLPFLLKESCIVMIGYGLGDTNVLTALDWAKNVYTNVNGFEYDLPMIQIVYKEDNLKKEPYSAANNITIIETDDLENFFRELYNFIDNYEAEYSEKSGVVKKYIEHIGLEREKYVSKFIDKNDDFRKKMLEFLNNLEYEFGYFYNSFQPFIGSVLLSLNEASKEKNNFEAHNIKLCIILDIFSIVQLKKLPIPLRGLLVYELNKTVDNFDVFGIRIERKSYVATDSCQEQDYRYELPEEVIDELWLFYKSNTNEFSNLKPLLESIPSKEPNYICPYKMYPCPLD